LGKVKGARNLQDMTTKPGKGGRKKAAKRQWRDYRTENEGRPIEKFFDALTDDEAAAVLAGMKEVEKLGLPAARHLDGDIYEVITDSATRSFRLLFATEGRYSQILLSLSGYEKRGQKTPRAEIDLAERRLSDWRRRGAARRGAARRRRR